MQIEYLDRSQIISWGTVFEYDTRANLVSNSNINSWITYPYPDVNYDGLPATPLGYMSPLAGASAVILDIDAADESEYYKGGGAYKAMLKLFADNLDDDKYAEHCKKFFKGKKDDDK